MHSMYEGHTSLCSAYILQLKSHDHMLAPSPPHTPSPIMYISCLHIVQPVDKVIVNVLDAAKEAS